MNRQSILLIVFGCLAAGAVHAQDKPVVGLIPKAQKPIKMDGRLDAWEGAFVTPVHVGHPDFANRGGQFYLWDADNLYIGLKCLDQKPAHVGGDGQLWNGDAVEFYLDTRRGDKLGAAQFGPGTLHMFWTAFTKTEIKPSVPDAEDAAQVVCDRLGRPVRFVDEKGYEDEITAGVVHPSKNWLAWVRCRQKTQANGFVDIEFRLQVQAEDRLAIDWIVETYNPYFGCRVEYMAWHDDWLVMVYEVLIAARK